MRGNGTSIAPEECDADSIPQFRHITPAFRTFSGHDALSALPRELERLGAERVVIFCGASMVRHETALERVESAVGRRLVGRFESVREHSPVPTVMQARNRLAELDADGVIAVGGGSSIVTARAATILLAEDRSPHDLCTRRVEGRLVSPKLGQPKIPVWVAPSTPTTAYARAGSAVRDPDTGQRLSFFDPKTRAQGVFFDPVIASTAPIPLAVGAGLTAFVAAVDGLQSANVDPLAEALLSHSLRMLLTWLPRAVAEPDRAGPRLQLMAAALLSGQGSDFVGSGLAASISHALGPKAASSNGVVEALLLPHTIRYNQPVTRERLTDIAAHIGDDTSADAVLNAVHQLLDAVASPRRLRDIGISPAVFDEVIEHVADDWFTTQVPRPADRVQLLELLTAAW